MMGHFALCLLFRCDDLVSTAFRINYSREPGAISQRRVSEFVQRLVKVLNHRVFSQAGENISRIRETLFSDASFRSLKSIPGCELFISQQIFCANKSQPGELSSMERGNLQRRKGVFE